MTIESRLAASCLRCWLRNGENPCNKVIGTQVYANKARKKECVTNTFTGANNIIEHFFIIMGEKNLVCSYITNVYVFLRCIKKAQPGNFSMLFSASNRYDKYRYKYKNRHKYLLILGTYLCCFSHGSNIFGACGDLQYKACIMAF